MPAMIPPIHLPNTSECSNWTHLYGRDLYPYNDIDGWGVLLSFIGTGVLVVVVLIFNYMVAHDPEQYPFPTSDDAEQSLGPPDWWKPNPIDVMFLSWIRKIGRKCPPSWHVGKSKRIEMAFNRAILIMCDIQIFTGISVMISGFVLLFQGIQAYHWQLIVFIAWFSSITHLSAMTVLRTYLRRRRVETCVRFGLMICLLIMLIVAFIPTAFFDWTASHSVVEDCSAAYPCSPAICFFDIANVRRLSAGMDREYCGPMTPPSNPAGQAMVVSLVLLIFGFVSRSVKLFKFLSMAVHVYLRRPISKRAQQVFMWLLGSPKTETAPGPMTPESMPGNNLYLQVLHHPFEAMFLSFRITSDLIESMLAEVYWLLVLVAWGTTRLLVARGSVNPRDSIDQQETWTFGQILPMLLLVAPIWSLVTAFAFDKPTQTSSTYTIITHFTTLAVGDSSNIRENQTDPSATCTTHRYISCYWIRPCLTFICLMIIALTLFQVFAVAVPLPLLDSFWINGLSAIYVVLLVYPFSLQCSILIGLVYEKGFLGLRSAPSRPTAYKALLWLAIFFVWVFFTMTWLSSTLVIGWHLEPKPYALIIRCVGTVGGATVLHLIYGVGLFFQSFRNRSSLIQ